jgi:hypothetical protein
LRRSCEQFIGFLKRASILDDSRAATLAARVVRGTPNIEETNCMRPLQKIAISGALVGASIAGGALGASMVGSANAQTTSTTASSSTESPSAGAQASFPAHGSAEHEAAEKAVTGDTATKVQDAAVKAAGGGTAGDVTTDYSGTGYEVTVTKSDGTQVEYHLDSSFNVMVGGHGGAPQGAESGTA